MPKRSYANTNNSEEIMIKYLHVCAEKPNTMAKALQLLTQKQALRLNKPIAKRLTLDLSLKVN